MKKIYQIISILLAMCLLTSIVGCRKKEQKADAKYTIYQINQSGTALVPKDYDGTGKSVDDEVKGMLSALQKCDDEVKAQAALPKNDDPFADCYIAKQQLDASRGAWFRKNNWKLKIIMEQFGWTRKFLYHKILVELSDIYDLELEEKFYVQRFGYRPEYKLDLLDGSKSLARLATGYINYLLTEEGDY